MYILPSTMLASLMFLMIKADQAISNIAADSAVTPWQYKTESQYWFQQFNQTLDTMQTISWSGATWLASAQWLNAFLNTLISSCAITLTTIDRPEEFGTISAMLNRTIDNIHSEVHTFFDNEDTVQIFESAYDDVQWVVLEWLEAIDLVRRLERRQETNDGQADIVSYAHRAHIFYNVVQNKSNASLCEGGLTWNPKKPPYKNAITNELFVASSAAMFLYWPGDTDNDPYPSRTYWAATNKTLEPLPQLSEHAEVLSDNARITYEWLTSHNFTNSQGLIADGFHISPNQTTCDLRSETVFSYNQGVLLSGLRGLYEITGNADYLSDGYHLITTVLNATGWRGANEDVNETWSGLGRNGIMEEYCDAPANCTTDARAFKGIFFHHLSKFCQPWSNKKTGDIYRELSKATEQTEHHEMCASYAPWVAHNAAAALNTKNSSGIIGGWWGAGYAANTTNQTVYQRDLTTHMSGLAVVKAALEFHLWQ